MTINSIDPNRLVRYEKFEDMGDIVTISHSFPTWVSEEKADEWMTIKADVRTEVASRVPIKKPRKAGHLRLVSA